MRFSSVLTGWLQKHTIELSPPGTAKHHGIRPALSPEAVLLIVLLNMPCHAVLQDTLLRGSMQNDKVLVSHDVNMLQYDPP